MLPYKAAAEDERGDPSGQPNYAHGQRTVAHQSRGAVEMNTPFDVSHVTPLTGKVTRHGLQHMGLFLRVGNRHIIESLWHYFLNVPERE